MIGKDLLLLLLSMGPLLYVAIVPIVLVKVMVRRHYGKTSNRNG